MDALERRLYLARKGIESAAFADGFSIEEVHVNSFSCRTVVCKGMFVAPKFERFYPDLGDPEFEIALAVIHQRYSSGWCTKRFAIEGLKGGYRKLQSCNCDTTTTEANDGRTKSYRTLQAGAMSASVVICRDDDEGEIDAKGTPAAGARLQTVVDRRAARRLRVHQEGQHWSSPSRRRSARSAANLQGSTLFR
jgi:hypothetical protein